MTNETISDNALDDFFRVTQYNLDVFFKNYINFIDSDYAMLSSFYSGQIDTFPANEIKTLQSLIQEQKKIVEIITLNASSLSNYEQWIVLEYIEDIGSILETADNMSKWLRSFAIKGKYQNQISSSRYTSQGQGIEEFERDQLKSSDPDQWVDTAIDNELREEDYTRDGGYLIKSYLKNRSAFFLNSVVDNIDTAEKSYGLDIDQYIAFEDDDLKILSYQDTIKQAVSILINLSKGSDIAFPSRGLDTKNILGINLVGVSYPIIFRQLGEVFATDDSLKSFAIKDIRRNQDAIFIDFEVETRAGEVFNDSVRL